MKTRFFLLGLVSVTSFAQANYYYPQSGYQYDTQSYYPQSGYQYNTQSGYYNDGRYNTNYQSSYNYNDGRNYGYYDNSYSQQGNCPGGRCGLRNTDSQYSNPSYSNTQQYPSYNDGSYDYRSQQNPNYSRENYNYGNQNVSNTSQSDAEINNKIRDALSSGIFSKGYENVRYQVNNGNVTLSGSVQTADDKNKVEEKVRNIDGVRSVNSNINVIRTDNKVSYNNDTMQNRDVTDADITAKINDYLQGGLMSKSYDRVIVEVNMGHVVLKGSVDTIEDKNSIDKKVRDIKGVRSLNNQINVLNRR